MSGEVEDGAAVRTELARDDAAAICAAFPPRGDTPRDGWAAALVALAALVIACPAGWWIRRRDRRRAARC